ncbi:MAG: hypothetical protein V4618_05695 [Pseudomonadota bacterium]
MLRSIALLLAAFALFLSPVLMTGAEDGARAAMPEATAMDAHCAGMMPDRLDNKNRPDSKGSMKIDCAAACSALHATASSLPPRPFVPALGPSSVRVAPLDGIDLGRELPPPRKLAAI